MRVAVCQMPDVPGNAARAVGLMRAWSLDAALHGAALVCFPEGFLQGYDLQPGHIARVAMELASPAFVDILRDLEALEPMIVFGMIEKEGGRTYNTAVAIERGRIRARYRKAHLLAPECEVFEAGRDCAVFDVGGTRVALNVCHDVAHDESVRRASEAGARLLLCPCNNMLPRLEAEAWKHRHNEIRCRQARDHRLWIAAAEITGERNGCIAYGPTAVIDPGGTIVAQVPLMQIGLVVADIG